MHDPLALGVAIDPSFVTTRHMRVDVETRGSLTTGMTVADRRKMTGRAPNLDVAVEEFGRPEAELGDLVTPRG